MHPIRTLTSLVAGSALIALAACGVPPAVQPPPDRPAQAVAAPPTQRSVAAAAYYANVQRSLLAQDMLRTDPGTDIPLTDRMLAENFLRIAFYSEYDRNSAINVHKETEKRLTRWNGPIRVSVRFGDSFPEDRRAAERARIASYLSRLSALIGLPVGIDELNPNFWVYIVNEDEREAIEPSLRALPVDMRTDLIQTVTLMPPSTYCTVMAWYGDQTYISTAAVVVIKAENPDLLRLSCIHEEIAQAMGLPNDSPRARPSIFNDDEEFALLTDQDELMLRMLYSPELRPGLSADEARSIVESLARRLTGGDS